jgi:hypothetical protein
MNLASHLYITPGFNSVAYNLIFIALKTYVKVKYEKHRQAVSVCTAWSLLRNESDSKVS